MSLSVSTSWWMWSESADWSVHEVTARIGCRSEKEVWPLVSCLFEFKYKCSHDECTVHHILVLINCEYRYHSGSSVCPNSFHSTRVPHSFWYTGDQLVPINIQLHLGRNIVLSDSLATIVWYSLRIATQEFHSWGRFDDTSWYGCAHLWDLKWQSNHLSGVVSGLRWCLRLMASCHDNMQM